MIKHIFKLIKAQWKNNIWIILELFIVLSLMWYVVDYFSVMYISSRTPVGFEIKDTFVANLAHYQKDNPNHIAYEENSEEPGQNFFRIVDRIRNHPDVIDISIGQWHFPYCTSNTFDSYRHDSLVTYAQILHVTPAYFQMFKIHPAGKNNPSLLGEALEKGVIISSSMEEILFPGSNATGQTIFNKDSTDNYYVAGVATSLKNHLFTRPGIYIYFPFREHMVIGKNEPDILTFTDITFQTRPGMNEKDFVTSFKKEMNTQLRIGNFYCTGVTPINELREFALKSGGVYEAIQNRTGFAVFFLVNVFLGVIGAFWLRIKRRKEEIGLRIALGSSRRKVMKLMIMESIILMVMAAIPTMLIWFNLVNLEVLSVRNADITWQRLLLNTALTFIPLILVILLATWYPARRSANIQPAEALHYE